VTNERSSPWWYRRRDAVFGMIYGLGFMFGGLISGWLYGVYVPAYVVCGSFGGRSGVFAFLLGGAVLTVACFALRLWGSSYLSEGIVWSDNARVDRLLVNGPFRFTRNPLYLGNLLMALGVGVLASPAGWAIIIVGACLFVLALMRFEERGLRARYGEQFTQYRAEVPALLPRLQPAPKSVGGVPPSLGAGLRAEVFSGAIALGMVAVLLLGRTNGLYAFAALFIIGSVAQRLTTRAGRRRLQQSA